ncbi:acyl-CoA dehydrogenase family protein [Streptomyces gilvosporeus]|uniref:Acyl-CoA dehydrogenase n=1 Tax=Streptomyces gilvosporeus TaxID=553510 RepID=A0A1V0TNF6_9ACTN|nr:acyl-CoA dehydrogenase [Streptomyces gilvosporeus]ARF54328.1 hypothetical protein B1H19_09065 [Streptomyces gilvosporeus]
MTEPHGTTTGAHSRAPREESGGAHGALLASFVAEHSAPGGLLDAARWEAPGSPPVRELLATAGGAGLFRAAWRGDGALARAVALHTAFARAGNGAPGAAVLTHLEVSARLLAGLLPDDSALHTRLLDGTSTASLAVTEPDAPGSDLSSLRTEVRGREGALRVSGEKWFISNAPHADLLLVLAADPDRLTSGREGPALLLVDADAPGVRTEPVEGCGHHGLTGRLTLDEAPVRSVPAPAGRAMLLLGRHWIHERVMLAVRMAALAAAVLEHTAEGARTRHTFGAPLTANQHVRFTLAALRAETEEVRAAALQAVRLLESGGCPAAYAAACKYRAAEVLRRVADEAVQLAGADAYVTGHPAERALRDGEGLALAGGTDELMLMQIERG